jgi:site-specific recombinase XerD
MGAKARKGFEHHLYKTASEMKKELSFSTVATRIERLKLIRNQLEKNGFVVSHPKGFKQKHVISLVKTWKDDNLSVGRMKNMLSDLRYICSYYNRENVVPKNELLGIGQRTYVAQSDKSQDVDFNNIKDRHLKASLELQKAFGLRREECLKIKPHLAHRDGHLKLEGSWCKGNIERIIPIKNPQQLNAIKFAKNLVLRNESLIPNNQTYKERVEYYSNHTRSLNLKNLHGLRHAYAQTRFEALAGFKPPIKGGKKRIEMTADEKKRDHIARRIVSEELGHSRLAVTKVYLG